MTAAPPVTGQLIRLNSRKRRFVPNADKALFNLEMMQVQFVHRHSGARQRVRAKRGPMTGSARARSPYPSRDHPEEARCAVSKDEPTAVENALVLLSQKVAVSGLRESVK